MARREFGTGGRLVSCFMMVYLNVVTRTAEPSEETNENNSVNVLIQPDSATGDHSDTSTVGREEPQAEANNGKLHPVIRIVQEKDLGKAVIAFPIPIAMAIMTAGKDKLAQSEMNFILVLVCLGFTAILNGILLKETYPKFAQIVEPVGIVMVATSFFAIVAFFLPVEISWVPAVCIALCLVPFVIAIWQPPPT